MPLGWSSIEEELATSWPTIPAWLDDSERLNRETEGAASVFSCSLVAHLRAIMQMHGALTIMLSCPLAMGELQYFVRVGSVVA